MRYFSCKAEQAFKTTPSGVRIFCQGGPVYVVPDGATEQKLFAKEVWRHRILWGGFILLQPLLFIFFPQILWNSYLFLAYLLVGLPVVAWVVGRILFARDLRCLPQTDRYPRWNPYVTTYSHGRGALVFGFIMSLSLVLGGIFLMYEGKLVIGIISVMFFGLCTFAFEMLLKWDRKSLDQR